MLFAQKNPSVAPSSDYDVRDSLKEFTEVYSIVEANYAEPLDADKAIYDGAIPGMLHVLDPHSNFFDPKAYSLLKEDQRGKYYGVGMQVGPRNVNNRTVVIVIAPFVALRRIAPASAGRHYRGGGWQGHRPYEHVRRSGLAERPERHDGSHHHPA